eukprot:TRINITY_DN4307_c0_g1_i1.p1 TRINITY_DN4307_c0_g1~~TRINITY_DN4307_c0_g1_i1.p1  ORF type:complete len:366 (+),score=116.07 TRINITY_DN4307_c0_g1_i1:60-1157(+)
MNSNERRSEYTPLLTNNPSNVELISNQNTRGSRQERMRKLVYSVIEGGWKPYDKIVEWFILILIAVNVILFILSTEESIVQKFGKALDITEIVSIGIFTVEYALRLWVCVEKKKYRKRGPIKGRIKYIFTVMSIIDLLSIIPFWTVLALDVELLNFSSAIRIFRVFRLFKAEKYTHALKILKAVLLQNREVLITTGFILLILFICTSTALYLSQKDAPSGGAYSSIPNAMYTTLLMLTAQGIPEDFKLTYAGKWVTAITCVFSVAVFAVPAGLLGWGFESVGEKFIEERKQKEKRKKRERRERVLRGEISASSSSSSSDFFGDSSGEDEEEEKKSNASSPHPMQQIQTNGNDHSIALCPHCMRPF